MISKVDMAEEFQVCSANWWNSPKNLFGSSPCSWAVNDFGNLGWPSNCDEPVMDVNNTVISSDDSAGSASDGSCTTFPDAPKSQLRISNGSLSTDCWNQDFLHESGRSEKNYSQIRNYRQENWINPKNFCEDLSGNPFKQVIQDFSIHHQPLNSTANSIESCAATCEEIPFNFPLNPSSYSYTSSLMQNLLGQDNPQPHVLSFLDDQEMNYLSDANCGMNQNELLLSSLPKSSSMVIQPSRQQPANHLLFSNNTARFWNATPPFRNDSSNFIPSTNSPILPSIHNSIENNIPINISAANNHEGARDVVSMAKKQNSSERAIKRPRIETPSPLPTFKVRKEKLGDRVTALQQLVSPFGKTDTASVLHEAIEYIKFLHDQVKVLSTPYLKNGSPPVLQHQQAAGNKPKDREGLKIDLKGRGLCLVPISSTSPVAAETTSDFWTHTFGVSFR
ncbi:transcription factor bHLH112-like [Primulina eburnea]|uniref:transcription factor bHLH112-like n=1 Tax=Primulina eburnea TaxID=1245227 RepID=UPI003C6BEEB1